MLPSRWAIAAAMVAWMIFKAEDALAQADVRGQSVVDRSRPEFDSKPININGIEVTPTVTIGATYDSNILARSDIVISDALVTVEPRLVASLDRGLANVTFDLRSYHARYLSTPRENTDDFSGSTRVVYGDSTDTRLETFVEYSKQSESRSSIDSVADTAVRGRFEKIVAGLGATQRFGSFTAQIHGGINRLNYFDVRDSSGAFRDFSHRDFTAYYARGELAYSRSGSSSLFMTGEYRRREYDLSPGNPAFDPAVRFDRSGDSFTVEMGYQRQVTSLLFARAGIGYLNYRFDDQRLPEVSALAFHGSLLWNVTPLTSIQAYARRSVDETVAPDLAGVTRTEFSLKADHELRRNLILSASARYADLSPIGLGRASHDYTLRVSATYLKSRRWRLSAFAQQRSRTSADPVRSFDATTFGISVTYGF